MPEIGALGVAASAQVSIVAPGREVNQDAVGRWAPDLMTTRARMGVVYVVADGVGPRDSGQVASQTAVESTLKTYRRAFDGSPTATLDRSLRETSQSILGLASNDPSLQGMASTCTAAVVHNSRLIIGHVGDSRAYLIRHGHARQLTQDHTWAGEQESQGLERAQLEQHPLRSAPTRLLGAAADVAVDILEEPLQDGDVIVLCTDGLSATLDDAAIAKAVNGDDASGAADRLVRAARTAGSSDDISVIVLIVEPVLQPTDTPAPSADSQPSSAEAASSEPIWSSPVKLAGIVALAVALVGLGFIWLYQLAFNQRIYPGVHALSVDLGGRSADEATRALETQFSEYARQAITLEVAGQQFYLTAGELGVRLDAAATAQRALQIGRSGTLARQLFEQARGLVLERDTPLVYQVDDARMESALTPLAERVESTTGVAEDAALLIEPSGTIRIQASRPGRTLDRSASAEVIRDRLQALGAGTLRLPTAEVPPNVSEADLAAPRAIAERMLAQPLTVTSGNESIQLDRSQIASILSVRKALVDGRSQVSLHLLDGETSRLLRPLAERVARPPVHARFNWSPGGLSVVVPGADGQQLDLSTAAAALEQQVLIQGGPATLPPQPVHALGLDDADTLNIRELVLDASLPLGGVDQWTRANTDRALGDLHGRLVLPGQTLSLLDALGTLNEGRGYRSATDDASVIARGVNLVASSLAQVVFWTGYGIEERQAPAHWTVRAGEPPRGQPGLDAAVDAAENRDFRFTNNTQQPLLIQSYIYGDNAIVALYGTRPTWTVQVLEPVITAATPPDDEPERREDPSAPMGQEVWIEDRSDGFSVSLQRSVITSGETSPRTLNLTSRYAPSPGRILVGTKPSG